MNRFLGKYRALVVDTNDPEKRGRIKVQCPKAYGDFKSPWCLPCVPYAGDGVGFIALPPKGEVVWIEFEEGDTDYPIWVGSWWTPKQTPLTTAEYNAGVVKIKHKSGSSMTMNKDGSITVIGDIKFTGKVTTTKGLEVGEDISTSTITSINAHTHWVGSENSNTGKGR